MISAIQKSPQKNNFNKSREQKTKTKIASSAGSLLGLSLALSVSAKRHRTNFADVFKKVEFDEKDVIGLASASIGGGLLGGIMTDQKNKESKIKEGIVQLVGNYIIPSIFVGAGIKANKALNKKYNFPPLIKPVQFVSGAVSLIAGVFLGNKVSRKINEEVFNGDNHRALNWKDWALQFDNACLVTSMSTSGSSLAQVASKVIPFALFVPGYLVGTKTNDKN